MCGGTQIQIVVQIIGVLIFCGAALCSAGCEPVDHLEIQASTDPEMIQRFYYKKSEMIRSF